MTGASVLGSQLSASFREDLHWNQDLKALWKNANLSEGSKHLRGFDQKLLGNFSPGDFFWALSCQSSLSRAEIVSLPECSLLQSGEALLSFYPPVAILLLFWLM